MSDAIESLYEQYYSKVIYTRPTLSDERVFNLSVREYMVKVSRLVGAGNVPLLHIKKTGKAITSSAELKEFWQILQCDNVLNIIGYTGQEAYLKEEHQQNLEKIRILALCKEPSYSAKEIVNLCNERVTKVTLATFYAYMKEIRDFPKPINPSAKSSRRWSKEVVEQKMFALIKEYKEEKSSRRVVPIRAKNNAGKQPKGVKTKLKKVTKK